MGELEAAEGKASDTTREALIDRFTGRAERVLSVVHRCGAEAEVVRLVETLAGGAPVSVSSTLLERNPGLCRMLGGRVELVRPSSPEEAARAAVGVSAGEAAVVETGSVLVAEHRLDDRLVSMLSPVLVQVVPAAALLASLDEVGAALSASCRAGGSGYHALVTGPSRSADIERSMTVGVQGPAELHVVLLSSGDAGTEPAGKEEG